MAFFVSFDLCCFKVYFIRDENCNSCFLLLSICLVNLPPSFYFELMCVFARDMGLLNTAHRWVLMLYPVRQSVSLTEQLAPLQLGLILFCVNLILPLWCWLLVLPISWCSFFTALMVFTLGYYLAVAGTICSFPCLVLPSGALVRQAWRWQNFSTFACLERILFLLSL